MIFLICHFRCQDIEFVTRTIPYLSILIAHKLSIDAVHKRTSNEIQISHKIQPNFQDPVIKIRPIIDDNPAAILVLTDYI